VGWFIGLDGVGEIGINLGVFNQEQKSG